MEFIAVRGKREEIFFHLLYSKARNVDGAPTPDNNNDDDGDDGKER